MKHLCDYCQHHHVWCDGTPEIVIEEDFMGLAGEDITLSCDEFLDKTQYSNITKPQTVNYMADQPTTKTQTTPISLVEEALIIGLRDILAREALQITFTTAKGDVRVMECTLDPDQLPPMPIKEATDEATVAKKLTRNIPVYEIGVGWRSFNVDRLTEVKRIF